MKKVLSFDCGGTNTRLALINEKFEIEKELVTPTPIDDADKWMNNIIKMVEQFPLENVIAIGAGVPGQCDVEKGIILDMSNVHVFNIKFRQILEEKFNIPVYVRNDAEVACLGEAYMGAGRDYSRVFFITISTGLGGALCIDQKIQDYIHEIGHTAYVYKNHVSEYEKLVSGLNVHRIAEFNDCTKIKSAKDMFDGVRKNDPECQKVFMEWLFVVNEFINLVKNTYLPEIICITGGLTKSKDLFLDKLIDTHSDIIIKECEFGERAGLMGASVLAMQGAKII